MAKACVEAERATTGSRVPAVGTIRTAKNWSVVASYVEMAPAKMAPLVRVVGATQIATVVSVGRALVVVKSARMADGNLGETESVKRGHRDPHVARALTVLLSGLNPLACVDTRSASLGAWERAVETMEIVTAANVGKEPVAAKRGQMETSKLGSTTPAKKEKTVISAALTRTA